MLIAIVVLALALTVVTALWFYSTGKLAKTARAERARCAILEAALTNERAKVARHSSTIVDLKTDNAVLTRKWGHVSGVEKARVEAVIDGEILKRREEEAALRAARSAKRASARRATGSSPRALPSGGYIDVTPAMTYVAVDSSCSSVSCD